MDLDVKLILALIPLVLINYGLVAWCIIDWAKRKKFRYFKKWIWFLIFILFQYIGPVFYLIIGRDHEND
jgi:hypothetical protein